MATIYRPHFSTRFVGLMQNPVLAIIGLIFLLTGLKWGAMLFVVRPVRDGDRNPLWQRSCLRRTPE